MNKVRVVGTFPLEYFKIFVLSMEYKGLDF